MKKVVTGNALHSGLAGSPGCSKRGTCLASPLHACPWGMAASAGHCQGDWQRNPAWGCSPSGPPTAPDPKTQAYYTQDLSDLLFSHSCSLYTSTMHLICEQPTRFSHIDLSSSTGPHCLRSTLPTPCAIQVSSVSVALASSTCSHILGPCS